MGGAVALLVHHHQATKPSEAWLHEWLVCCRARFKLLDARDLATVAWAASCLRHRPGPVWIEEFAREAGRRLHFFDAQVLPHTGVPQDLLNVPFNMALNSMIQLVSTFLE
jgi:hypothetical protein